MIEIVNDNLIGLMGCDVNLSLRKYLIIIN
jgi:hypothetical protein